MKSAELWYKESKESLGWTDRDIARIREIQADALEEAAELAERVSVPGPGRVNITGGVPSEVYIDIGRAHYSDQYESAKAAADSVRSQAAQYIRALKSPAEQEHKKCPFCGASTTLDAYETNECSSGQKFFVRCASGRPCFRMYGYEHKDEAWAASDRRA